MEYPVVYAGASAGKVRLTEEGVHPGLVGELGFLELDHNEKHTP